MCRFNDGIAVRLFFPRSCLPINSALYLLFAFFSYCILLRVFLLLASVVSFVSLRKELESCFCAGDFVSRHSFAAGVFVSRQQPFSFRASFGTCTLAIVVPFVAFVGSFGLGFWFVWAFVLGKSLASVV